MKHTMMNRLEGKKSGLVSGAWDWEEKHCAGLQAHASGCSVPWDTFVRAGWLLMDHPMEE